ncbi:MAG TPA: hypothetical protein VKV15_21070 [Bryobacteraceae bacterium]|nr:hypothetical protein [Bryobacteraceae bacterium]
MNGQCFRLRSSSIAIQVIEGRRSIQAVSVGSIVRIVDSSIEGVSLSDLEGSRLVKVKWGAMEFYCSWRICVNAAN